MPTLSFIKVTNGWPSIEIGAMRHQIQIIELVPVGTNAAGPAEVPQLFAKVMAAIEPISGKDQVRGGQTTTQLLVSMAIWYIPGIRPNMQVLSDSGSKFIIQSIENVLELNVVLTLNTLGLGANQ
jgi:head-tail adaptor